MKTIQPKTLAGFLVLNAFVGLGINHAQEVNPDDPPPAPEEDTPAVEEGTPAVEETIGVEEPPAEQPAETPEETPPLAAEETPPLAEEGEDLLIEDFEGDTFGTWTVNGEAFGEAPATGAVGDQMEVSQFQGNRLANSFHGGDESVGSLTSPTFTIERPFINMLVGGGRQADALRVDLMVDGQAARTKTGNNSEALMPASWDVSELKGKEAALMITDQSTGGWGHLLVDHLVQSNTNTGPILTAQERQLPAIGPDDRFMNLPVKTGAPKTKMALKVDGAVVREFDIELSDEPDLWMFADMTPFAGKAVTVSVDALDRESGALAAIELGDTIKDGISIYQESLRPQFHFTTKRGWINDPNGLVYYKGEYHLFYQHNPYGYHWGNMHWGHAVSRDLVHWEQLPIAIYPKAYGDWAFSGGALVDKANTGGFRTGKEDVIVAFYTSTGRGECLVYSNDRGRSFQEYEGNPVVEHPGRDPKVIWHHRSQQWVMAVYTEQEGERAIAFHTSPNLKDWTYQSRLAGFYECPELFELPLDLNAANTKWVLYGADGNYVLGQFDGKTFALDDGFDPANGEKATGNYGNCFYASQMFSNLPSYVDRHVQIGWGRVQMPGMPFNQMMLFPCKLQLRTTDDGPRLFTNPVNEIKRLYQKSHVVENQSITGLNILTPEEAQGGLYDIEATFQLGDAKRVGFNIRGIPVLFDGATSELSCQDKKAPLEAIDGKVHLRLLVDRTSIEIFANDGEVYMPMGVIPDDTNHQVAMVAEGGSATVIRLRVSELKSIWTPKTP